MTSEKINKIKKEKPKKGGEKRKMLKFTFSRKHLCIPYAVFLVCFVIFPLLLIVYYAFTAKDGSFTFANFAWFFSDPVQIKNLFFSMLIGLITTAVCLLIGYPVAYVLSRIKSHRKTILLLLFIMPMWINFVLRAMAMKELMSLIGIFGKYDTLNVIIGMVYDYLPFMILPLYTTLIKMDKSLEEAAADLGAGSVKIFTSVTLPLSIGGIASGITMVFLPTMTCYVISDTFSNSKVSIIGKLIANLFGQNSNWNNGSVVALILLIIMFACTILTGGFTKEDNARGTNL